MRVTLLKFAAPLEQFSRARVGLAAHRTASLENTDVALACFNLYRSASRIEAQNAAVVQLLRLAGGIPKTGADEIVPVPPAEAAPSQVAIASKTRRAAAPKKRHAAKKMHRKSAPVGNRGKRAKRG